MSILSSAASIVRYRVEGRLEESVLETVSSGLHKHAITEIDDDHSDKSVGWTSFNHPFQPDFKTSSVMVGNLLVFCLRIDKKTIPSKLFKKYVALETARRLEAGGHAYLSKNEKSVVHDHVANLLSRRIPATPNIYDLIWNYEDGFVWFFSTLKIANEELETLFIRSFNLTLIRLFPYTTAELMGDLSHEERDRLTNLSPTDFTG